MSKKSLKAEAERVVRQIQARLPKEISSLARKVPVLYYDWPSDEILGEEFEPDILGLFVGNAHGQEEATGSATHIILFLENIMDAAEGDWAAYREEVRLTYLHELGHYLGWDEDDLEARGLE
jgi:predicted Zn-dependent protease with MMP-like domain